ncbi:PilZ domain-containing protein [Clostridiaceae bacterium 35-E11]
MKDKSMPNIGERIEIELIDSNIGIKKKQLTSQVMDKINDYTIFVATPIYHNVLFPITIGTTIKIKYFKKSIGMYVFTAEVIGRKNIQGLSYIKVKRTSDITRAQRRNFFRLEVLLNAQIKQLKPYDAEEKVINALTKDISGGGTRIISKENLEVNSIVEIRVEMEQEPIVLKGKVIRCVSYEESDYNYESAIVFVNIHEKTREQIISFIFDYQRKMKKKGLI